MTTLWRLGALATTCVVAAAMLTCFGASAAEAYCPTDPSGMDYGSSDPASGNYSGTEIDCSGSADPGTGSLPGTTPAEGSGDAGSGDSDAAGDAYGAGEAFDPAVNDLPDSVWQVDWADVPSTGPIDWSKFNIGEGPVLADAADAATAGVGKLSIYEPTGDEPDAYLPFPFPGRTEAEIARSDKGGDTSTGAAKDAAKNLKVYKNPKAGVHPPVGASAAVTLQWVSSTGEVKMRTLNSVADLYDVADVKFRTSTHADGFQYVDGIQVVFNDSDLPSSQRDLVNAVFDLTRGTLNSCTGKNGVYFCDFVDPLHMGQRLPDGNLFKLTGDAGSNRAMPLCAGGIVDTGFGVTTTFSLSEAGCDAAPDEQPVSLRVDRVYAEVSDGVPEATYGGQSISFTPTAVAANHYVPARVWATTADGTISWPFTVIFRVRNAPTTKVVAPIDAIRSVETVVPGHSLFADVDVDQFQAESGDRLTGHVVTQPTRGTAYFDTAGDLHYVPLGLVNGTYDDRVTVAATDAFGLPSGEVSIPIHVGDVVPGCDTAGATTDALTPVRISLHCWLTAPAGWSQMPGEGLDYSVVTAPPYGTLTGLDPVAGTAVYTPDPAHPGPAAFTFQARYNGQTRDAQFAVNVLAAP